MAPDTPPFTPAPIRVRYVFQHPERGTETVTTDLEQVEHGAVFKGRDEWEVVARLFSTGLHDADGREVFEGDRLTWNEYHLGDGPDTTGVVVRSLTRMFLDVPELTMPFDIGSAIDNYGARVTGHIYAP